MKTKVVFVDDEPAVLSGLRDRLRRERHRWDLSFHDAPAAALRHIEALGADVVVSDVRMPGMNGAELLAEVRRIAPAATRVALTGQADAETALSVHVTAHQFLSKPCDVGLLMATIERRARLGEVLPRGALELAASAPEVPASPRTYRALSLLFSSERWGLDEVAAVLSEDVVAATHVMRVASSPYFGGRKARSIEEAVVLLGASSVQRIVLGLGAAGAFGDPGGRQTRRGEHSRHARAVAEHAAEHASPSEVSDAYVAGLLHDIGLLVLASARPTVARAVRDRARAGEPVTAIEQALLGFDHADVGAALLAIWGLPCDVVLAVMLHHREGGGPIADWIRAADDGHDGERLDALVGGAA